MVVLVNYRGPLINTNVNVHLLTLEIIAKVQIIVKLTCVRMESVYQRQMDMNVNVLKGGEVINVKLI